MKNNTIDKQLIIGRYIWRGLFFASTVILLLSIMYGVVLAQGTNTRAEADKAKSAVQEAAGEKLLSNDAQMPFLIEITDGKSRVVTSTTQLSPEAIISNSTFHVWPEDRLKLERSSTSETQPLVGYTLTIDRAKRIYLDVKGVTVQLRTHVESVEDLLNEIGISVGSQETVIPSLPTRLEDNMKIFMHGVRKETVHLNETVPFLTSYIDDPNIAYGTTTTKIRGVKGLANATYEITYYDGIEVSRVKLAELINRAPTNEVIIRGTKGQPVSSGPLNSSQIQFLGNCESGMTPTRNSGNGYYGAFQFSAGTWNAMGTGYARADLAPLDVQIEAVQRLLSRSSIFGQFPGCANAMVSAGLLTR